MCFVAEPSLLTCSICKSVYSSSWFLIQHVQKQHQLTICQDVPTAPASPRPSEKKATPGGGKSDTDDAKESSSLLGNTSASQAASSAHVTSSPVFNQHLPFAHLPTSSFLSSVAGAPSISLPWMNRPPFGGATSIPDLLPGVLPFGPTMAEYSSRLKSLAARDAPAAHPTLTSPGLPSAFTPPAQQKSKQNGVTSSSASRASEERGDVMGGKQCDKCAKSFKFESNLVLHKRTHSGVFPAKKPPDPIKFPENSHHSHCWLCKVVMKCVLLIFVHLLI